MTPKEFKELEKECREGWRALARTGSVNKQDHISPRYLNRCPACELSMWAATSDDYDCEFCPVTKWREQAQGIFGIAVCQIRGNEFHDWLAASSGPERSKAALAISKLRWSFIKKYKDVDYKLIGG